MATTMYNLATQTQLLPHATLGLRGAATHTGGGPPRQYAPPTPKQLGPYELKKPLVKVDSGKRIYAGRHIGTGLLAGVKYEPQLGALRPLLTREADILARCAHRHVIAAHDSGFVGEDAWYIATNFQNGATLRQLLTQFRRFRWPTARQVLAQTCSALTACHKAGIIHRDIKPSNASLSRRGSAAHVTLFDFGIAHDMRAPTLLPGAIMGTRHYMAPELWNGETPTVASDLYALGIMGFELLEGLTPFTGESSAAWKHAHETQSLPTVSSDTALPHAMQDLLQQLTAKNPADRPHDAAAVRRRILSIRAT